MRPIDRPTDRFSATAEDFFFDTYFPSLLAFAEAAKPKADLKKQVDLTKSLSQPMERAFQTSIEKVEERNADVLFTFFLFAIVANINLGWCPSFWFRNMDLVSGGSVELPGYCR